jgi:hypothetical protein
MMKLMYDLWEHVDRIRAMVLNSSATSPANRYWYACWAFIFKLFEITDIFTIAIVIHRVQFIANCLLIYLAAKQIFEPLLTLSRYDKYQNQWLSSLALSSVLIWLAAIGTVSTIQQAWIMWYSVNYQITLSFLLLSISLTVNILTIQQSRNIQIIKLFSAFILLVLILLFHAGELAYFIFYLPIFLICFMDKLLADKKRLIIIGAISLLSVYLGAQFYTNKVPLLFTLGKNFEWLKMAELIEQKGAWNVTEGFNRYEGNWNEMYKINVYILLTLGFLACFDFIKINKKVLSFVVLSLVFCFAPSYIFPAGFLSLVSYDGIVNRYYFASFLFLSLPLCIYLIINKFKFINYPVAIAIASVAIISIIYLYSKYYNNKGVYYQNVKSIVTSIKAKKLDVEVSDFDIKDIGKQIQIAEAATNPNDFMYCGSYGKMYMVAFLYNRKNVHFDRLRDIGINECEAKAGKLNKHVVYIK